MTRTTGRRGAAVVAAAAALGLGACGGQGAVTEAGDGGTVTAPAAGAGDTGSGAEDSVATDTGAGDAIDVEAGEEVAVKDLLERLKSPGEDQLGSFELTMDLAGGGEQFAISGRAELTGESPEMDLEMAVPEMGELHLILADSAVYVGIPGLTPEGDFFAVPAGELDGLGMDDLTDFIDIESTWEGWDQGAQTVTYVGPEAVEGEQMDHYAVVVDTSAAAEAVGGTEGMPPELTYDVWVDEADLMRRVSFELDGGTVDMMIDNWGEDFDIQAPPPENVTDMPSLGGGS